MFLSVSSNNQPSIAARNKNGGGGGGGGVVEVNCAPPKVFAERVNPRSSHPAPQSNPPQIS